MSSQTSLGAFTLGDRRIIGPTETPDRAAARTGAARRAPPAPTRGGLRVAAKQSFRTGHRHLTTGHWSLVTGHSFTHAVATAFASASLPRSVICVPSLSTPCCLPTRSMTACRSFTTTFAARAARECGVIVSHHVGVTAGELGAIDEPLVNHRRGRRPDDPRSRRRTPQIGQDAGDVRSVLFQRHLVLLGRQQPLEVVQSAVEVDDGGRDGPPARRRDSPTPACCRRRSAPGQSRRLCPRAIGRPPVGSPCESESPIRSTRFMCSPSRKTSRNSTEPNSTSPNSTAPNGKPTAGVPTRGTVPISEKELGNGGQSLASSRPRALVTYRNSPQSRSTSSATTATLSSFAASGTSSWPSMKCRSPRIWSSVSWDVGPHLVRAGDRVARRVDPRRSARRRRRAWPAWRAGRRRRAAAG